LGRAASEVGPEGYTDRVLTVLLFGLMHANDPAVAVVRCEVLKDPHLRVYELQRMGEGENTRWRMAMRSVQAGAAPVYLPLPDAKPSIAGGRFALEYRTLNGGRELHWKVEQGSSSLDVRTNFELEVNVEADLDPRVELMNTEGAITALSCAIEPKS
jgi:hypothetical protein